MLSPHPDLGEAKDDVPVEYDGEPFDIGFDAPYLIEGLWRGRVRGRKPGGTFASSRDPG